MFFPYPKQWLLRRPQYCERVAEQHARVCDVGRPGGQIRWLVRRHGAAQQKLPPFGFSSHPYLSTALGKKHKVRVPCSSKRVPIAHDRHLATSAAPAQQARQLQNSGDLPTVVAQQLLAPAPSPFGVPASPLAPWTWPPAEP
eukprot:9928610-Karenia_brevis.AAC.1